MATTYVTVAIPYVNATPHLGYAYELVAADIYARARRGAGDEVRFLGGTDDYSLKNVVAAEAAGEPVRSFVDRHAAAFQALADPLGISFDDFIRTSADPRHVPAVERLWRLVAERGDLYRKRYEGSYCIGCEQFYDSAETDDGCCPEHGTPLDAVSEENWFFRLSAYQDHLDQLISSDTLVIRPEPFRREVLAFIRSGLEDISVSRSVERARGWGVPVPGDPSQVVYVWFDALANYISALDFGEPQSEDYRRWWVEADQRVHVIGKGILRFHAVYWPAFLASAGQPTPTRIQVHPYLTVDGKKLSKSAGVTLDPLEVAGRYGADALRWFFARDVAEAADTDFTTERLVERANADLANGVGNTARRVITLAERHLGDIRAAVAEPLSVVDGLPQRVEAAISEFKLRDAAAAIADALAATNADIAATEPWRIAREASRATELRDVLGRQLASLREIAAALEPVTPLLASRLGSQLLCDGEHATGGPLFGRILDAR